MDKSTLWVNWLAENSTSPILQKVGGIDEQPKYQYNHVAVGNGCKRGDHYAMVAPAGRKKGR